MQVLWLVIACLGGEWAAEEMINLGGCIKGDHMGELIRLPVIAQELSRCFAFCGYVMDNH